VSPPNDKLFADSQLSLANALASFESTQQDIARALKDLNPRNTSDMVVTSKSGIRNYGQQNYNISVVAEDTVLTLAPPTYRLTVMEWPHGIKELLIKINDPDAQPINVLEAGNIIESDVPMERVFLSISPVIPSGSRDIKFMAGNLKVFPRPRVVIPPEHFFTTNPDQASIDYNAEKVREPWTSTAHDQGAIVAAFNAITGLERGHPFRIAGQIEFGLNCVHGTNQIRGEFKLQQGGTDYYFKKFFGGYIGRPIFVFDTGWMNVEVDGQTFIIDVEANGPGAVTEHAWDVQLWVWPS